MGLFEGWTEEHGSPMIETDDTGHVLTLVYFADWSKVWIGLPEIGSYYPGNLIKYNDTKLSNYRIVNMPGGERARITLYYKSPQKGSYSYPSERKDRSTVPSLSGGTLEKAVETHKDYQMKWNHSLAKKIGTSIPRPADWDTQTKNTISESASRGWMWVKDISDAGEGWTIDQPAEKKGVDFYIVPAPVVTEKTYYRSQSGANSAASTITTKQSPGNKFGKSGGEWLVIGANVSYEDGFWVAERSYQHADEWWDKLYT